ncbi:hypothetical protein JVT61DRAFT_12910 [Boletus reticuloceps]|uniref:non-specific serine/threonine protein kinase n=1 Tax=Boletus reticuloceps TaxID=495285 RepID=A0A8I2YU99_9AGAM|nr:hypothetical protein JVT61DRAFT_12910 [Boletus reticuloceps]
MLGARTKQVNSYGRRGSRIVNVSDRRDRESAISSASDVDPLPPSRPLKRENAIIISPAKPPIGRRRLLGSNRSPRGSPLAQNKATRDAATKRRPSRVESGAYIRQPLTPLRANGTPSNEQSPPSRIKGKSNAFTIKQTRTSMKPHVPVIPVDIIVFDEEGNMLKHERRLSHTEIQPNQARTVAGKSRRNSRSVATQPSTHCDQPRAIVISSDESEANDESSGSVRKNPAVPLAQSHSRPKSRRVEVVIPTTPFRKPKVSKRPPSPPPLTLTPTKPSALAIPSFQLGPTAVPSHLAPPIPLAKPRQLTPIRGSSSRSVFRRSPPTPSTPTDSDLSFDLAQLNLSDASAIDDLARAQPEYLVPLLNECAQTSPYEFSAFIESFPFDPIVQSSAEDEDVGFRKIGEASYSEVFGIGDVVLKIIPIRFGGESTHPETDEIPLPSDAEDVLKEIIVTKEIGEICNKFVKLLKTYVVRGKYPSLLLDLWDEYNERKGSESIRPDSFALMQVYAIIILPNGGPDLESFAFKNVSKSGWHQACGIFWQVARALEQAEQLVDFEHRDLHWGQILVKSLPVKKSASKCPVSRVAMDDTRFGVKVTIIDLGLSRMSAADGRGSKIYWTPFEDEIFEGKGDYQYDIYRMMRDLIGGTWKSFHPMTNVMWLHYLVTKLLHQKRLKHPEGKRQTGGVTSLTGYGERECYDCLMEMERLLSDRIASARKGQKVRRKTVAPSSGPKSARDVIAYGMRRGWIQ